MSYGFLQCNFPNNQIFENVILQKQHNHVADHTAFEVEKYQQQMKLQTSASNDKLPNQILIFATTVAPDEVQARLPDADTVKRVLRRTRPSNRPKDQQKLPELAIDKQSVKMPPIFFITTTALTQMCLFFTRHLRCLPSCNTWEYGWYLLGDSTFVLSTLYHPGFGQWYLPLQPLAYTLLQRKTHDNLRNTATCSLRKNRKTYVIAETTYTLHP